MLFDSQSEVTPREALFCVAIAAALLSVGFWISSSIGHGVNRRLLQYRQAAQIENNDDEFRLALKTDVGDAFVEGEFGVVDSVAHEKLPGRWASIEAIYQKYTMHTRVVHYTVSNGKGGIIHRTCTQTYWTWDTYRRESAHAKEVEFCGVRFPYAKFSPVWSCFDSRTVENGYHRRICFTFMPASFHASVYTALADGTISNNTPLHRGMTVEKLYKSYTTSHAVLAFWIVWGLLMAVAIVAFVLRENNWLED